MVAGVVADGRLELEVVHRFPNGAVTSDGHLRWDLTGLFDEVLTGLTRLAARHRRVVSIGIDTWAVDYGLLDADGVLIEEPIAYRDDRTATRGRRGARADRPRAALRGQRPAVPAVQHRLPARRRARWSALGSGPPRPAAARPARLLADRRAADRDHQRLDDRAARRATRTWSAEIIGRARTRRGPSCSRRWSSPVEPIGTLPARDRRADRAAATRSRWSRSARTTRPRRWSACRMTGRTAAYISSGTWSLVGVELDAPGADRRQPRGQLHQRGRCRRPGPLSAQRRRAVAAAASRCATGAGGVRTSS